MAHIFLDKNLEFSLNFLESQYSDEDTPKKKTIMGAATQTYICESDADTGIVFSIVFLFSCLSVQLSVYQVASMYYMTVAL